MAASFKPISVLSRALGFSDAHTANLLGQLGIQLGSDDTFSVSDVRDCLVTSALDRLRRLKERTPENKELLAVAMGVTRDSCFDWLSHQFRLHGVRAEVVRTPGAGGARSRSLALYAGDTVRTYIPMYVALKLKQNGQAGFMVRSVDLPGVRWVAFIIPSWGCVRIRRREAIKGRALSLSMGVHERSLLQVIDEIKEYLWNEG